MHMTPPPPPLSSNLRTCVHMGYPKATKSYVCILHLLPNCKMETYFHLHFFYSISKTEETNHATTILIIVKRRTTTTCEHKPVNKSDTHPKAIFGGMILIVRPHTWENTYTTKKYFLNDNRKQHLPFFQGLNLYFYLSLLRTHIIIIDRW